MAEPRLNAPGEERACGRMRDQPWAPDRVRRGCFVRFTAVLDDFGKRGDTVGELEFLVCSRRLALEVDRRVAPLRRSSDGSVRPSSGVRQRYPWVFDKRATSALSFGSP